MGCQSQATSSKKRPRRVCGVRPLREASIDYLLMRDQVQLGIAVPQQGDDQGGQRAGDAAARMGMAKRAA